MQLIEWPRFLEESRPFGGKPSAVTIGVFDGVHLGHQALIRNVVAHNGENTAVAVTFRQSRYKKDRAAGMEHQGDILSFRQKLGIFENMGVSITVVIDFSETFRHMSGRDFLRILQEHGNMGFLAVGSNLRCGYRLDTDVPAIQKINGDRDIPTVVLQPLTCGAEPISSSRIRSAIARSDLKTAMAMLGRPFTVDLAGAAVSSSGESGADTVGFSAGKAYGIAALGRLLPPPGRYPVFLLNNAGRRIIDSPVEILVERGSLIIGREIMDALTGASPEYAEFLA